MAYGKIHESFWSDDKIVSLPDDAKLLAVYLITGPHRSAVGAMRLPIGYIVEDLRWTIPKCKAAIKELEAIGFIVRDDASGWTHVRNQIKYDPPQNDNQLKAAIKAARNIPIPGIFASVRECSARHTRDLGKGIATAFEGLANGFETVGECSPPPSAFRHPPSAVPQPPTTAPDPSRAKRACVNGWDVQFDEFWDAYPLKVGKQGAYKTYGRALKSAEHPMILEGAIRYRDDPNRDPGHTAHPKTWLNDGRWCDPLLPERNDPQGKLDRIRAENQKDDGNEYH